MDGESMTSYDVTVTRDGSLWAAVVDGLPPNVVGATDSVTFWGCRISGSTS
jgi:hypothetical protein